MEKLKLINAYNITIILLISFFFQNCSSLQSSFRNMNGKEQKKYKSRKNRLLLKYQNNKRRLSTNYENYYNNIESDYLISSNLIKVNKNEKFITTGKSDFGIAMLELDDYGNITMHNGFQDVNQDTIIPTSIEILDDGYYIIGYGKSQKIKGNIFVIQTNLDGEIIWSKNYGGIFQDFSGKSIISNNNIFLTAALKGYLSSRYNLGVISIPKNGNSYNINLWSYEGSQYPNLLMESKDNSSIFISGKNKLVNTNTFLSRLDYSNNEMDWFQIFKTDGENQSNSMKKTNDGNILMTGYKKNSLKKNGWILKCTENGKLKWSVSTDSNNDYVFFDSIEIDNQFLILGLTDDSNLVIIGLDQNGNSTGLNKTLDYKFKNEQISFIEKNGKIIIALSTSKGAFIIKLDSIDSLNQYPFIDINPNLQDITSSIKTQRKYVEKDIINSFWQSSGSIDNFQFQIKNNFIFNNEYNNSITSSTLSPFSTTSINSSNNQGVNIHPHIGETINFINTDAGLIIIGSLIGFGIFCILFLIYKYYSKKRIERMEANRNQEFIKFNNKMNKNKKNSNKRKSTSLIQSNIEFSSELRPLNKNKKIVNYISSDESSENISSKSTEPSSSLIKDKNSKDSTSSNFNNDNNQNFIAIKNHKLNELEGNDLINYNSKSSDEIQNNSSHSDKVNNSSTPFLDIANIINNKNNNPTPITNNTSNLTTITNSESTASITTSTNNSIKEEEEIIQ